MPGKRSQANGNIFVLAFLTLKVELNCNSLALNRLGNGAGNIRTEGNWGGLHDWIRE